MLSTRVDSEGVTVIYDGSEYLIIPGFTDQLGVAVMYRDTFGWHYYGGTIYESVEEACKAIFYGTILVDRTECGHIVFDEFGHISDIVPLSYYES